MKKIKITKISKSNKTHVYDISVKDNHNFFIKDKSEFLTHNCDYITPNAQAILRNLMEAYYTTCRFVLTCNYPQKVIPALHSRCQGFHIEKLDHTEFTARVATILVSEGVDVDLDTLDTYVKANYPDMRKTINSIQQNVVDGVLHAPGDGEGGSSDWMLEAVALFKSRKYKEARDLIVSQARPDEYEGIYRFMYENLEFWGETDLQQDMAVLKIREGLCNIPLCADPEINLCATLVELETIAAG